VKTALLYIRNNLNKNKFMKQSGVIILIAGLILMLISVFDFIRNESASVSTYSVNWSPVPGLLIMAAGGVFFLLGKKANNSFKKHQLN